jgi:hypothetical protein
LFQTKRQSPAKRPSFWLISGVTLSLNLKALRIVFFMLLYQHNLNWSMRNNTDIRLGRHCVFKLHVHLVFVTKYRRGVFTKAVLNELREIFSAVY